MYTHFLLKLKKRNWFLLWRFHSVRRCALFFLLEIQSWEIPFSRDSKPDILRYLNVYVFFDFYERFFPYVIISLKLCVSFTIGIRNCRNSNTCRKRGWQNGNSLLTVTRNYCNRIQIFWLVSFNNFFLFSYFQLCI